MSRNSRPGRLVTFEGLFGTGKSTLANRLHRELQPHYEVITVGEVSDDLTGDIVKSYLHTIDESNALSASLSFITDYFNMIENYIQPAIQSKTIVLKERYIDSLFACQSYQLLQAPGVDLGQALSFLYNIEGLTPFMPDLTIYLTAPEEVRQERLSSRQMNSPDVSEHELQFRRDVYEWRTENHPERILKLPTTDSIDKTVNTIFERRGDDLRL